MNEYLLLYVIFTYLYIGHLFVSKVKQEIPVEMIHYRHAISFFGVILWSASPAVFPFHIFSKLKNSIS